MSDRDGNNAIMWFLAGLGLGALVGVLYAPRSGRETRQAILDAAEEGRDYLERMQNAAARMQTLINDLLTFSRVISTTQPFVAVDLGVVTKEVLTDLEVRIEQTKAYVEVGELPTIEADPLQMRQLLQNLGQRKWKVASI